MSPSSTLLLLRQHHFFLLAFLLFPSFTTIALASSKVDLIHNTCNVSSSTDPNIQFSFCVHALQAAPASHCANLTQLGTITLRLAQDNASDTRCYIKQMLKRNMSLNPRVRAALKDCLELYSDSMQTLKEAKRDYRAQRLADANIKVSSVIDASDTCEDGFKEVGVASPLTMRNNFTFQLSSMALSIMNMLPSIQYDSCLIN
ncbi:hypothetical protein Ancab_027623 [Ancistrocladus abbreviatus]